MKRFSILILLLFATAYASAQKADVSFVAGGSFVSDTKATFLSSTSAVSALKTDHHLFLEGAVGLRLFDAKAASLYLDVPIAGIPSQKLTFSTPPSAVFDHMSTVFVTPSLKLKILAASPISPWASFGGGWARFSTDAGLKTNKGAVQYGGGLDFKTGLPVLGFRAEVRDFVTGDPNFGLAPVLTGDDSGLHRHHVLVGGGIVLRF